MLLLPAKRPGYVDFPVRLISGPSTLKFGARPENWTWSPQAILLHRGGADEMDFSFSKVLLECATPHLEKLSVAFEEFTVKEEQLSESGRAEFRAVVKVQTNCLNETLRYFCRSIIDQAGNDGDAVERVATAREEVTENAKKFLESFDRCVQAVGDRVRPRQVLDEQAKNLLRGQLRNALLSVEGLADTVQHLTTHPSDASRQNPNQET